MDFELYDVQHERVIAKFLYEEDCKLAEDQLSEFYECEIICRERT